jgi:ribonucleotide reductase beta subunit family protein with ferritin-like domain
MMTWKYGLKTGMYYLKSRPAVEAVQATVLKGKPSEGRTAEIVKNELTTLDLEKKYTLFPLKHYNVWNYYKKLEALTWKAEEIDFTKDKVIYDNLDEPTRNVIKQILAFFAISDGVVNENLQDNFLDEIKMKEAIKVYTSQALQESVHEEVYGRLIETLIKKEDQDSLFKDWPSNKILTSKILWGELFSNKLNNIPEQLEKYEQMEGHKNTTIYKMYMQESHKSPNIRPGEIFINVKKSLHSFFKNAEKIQAKCGSGEDKKLSFATRLVGIACLEGILFSSAFAFIYYIGAVRQLNMPGLVGSNAFIARDEGLHRDFAIFLYKTFIANTTDALSYDCIENIIMLATDIEIAFVQEILPEKGLIGLKLEDMIKYVQLVANNLALELINKIIYDVDNPFKWMDLISADSKTDQFALRVTEYSRKGRKIDFNQACVGCTV